jgi:hypothetical protein
MITESVAECLEPGYDKWITYDNKTCYFVSPFIERVTWHHAYDFCRSKNASLLSIHDQTTNNLLSRMVSLTNSVPFINYYYFWIGINSLSELGSYKWSDGTPTQFTNFATVNIDGKALNQDINSQGRCVSMRIVIMRSIPNEVFVADNTGLWYKEDCNSVNGYFCAKNFMTPTNTQLTPESLGNFPTGIVVYISPTS